ncbi:MAG: transposase [Saccharofermentanales bacterium]|jgi:transposase
MRQQYSKDFKQYAVVYVQTHPELSVVQCARNLGVNENTLHNWLKKFRMGEESRGQGNYSYMKQRYKRDS